MKALPKRKGNAVSERVTGDRILTSMKALPKRKGNTQPNCASTNIASASMKALPKRKGNRAVFSHLEYSYGPQ